MSSTISAPSVELQQRFSQQQHQPTQGYDEIRISHLSQNEVSQDSREVQQYLEPTDRGIAAWRLLGAAFVFEALLWGKEFQKMSIVNYSN